MRAQVLTAFGGPENFKLTDIPKPEVAVRVGRESSLSGSSRGQRFAAQRSGGPARHGRRPALLDGAGRPAKPESSAACELATRVPTSFRVVPAACLPLRTINMTLPLVTTDWLEERLGDPGLRVLEISNVNEPAAYCDGHVPGAAWLFWKDACWHESDRRFVTPEAMARLFGRLGIGSDDTVVLYGEPVQYGTYAYWAFTMAGHRDLRLLDGGRRKWIQEKRPLSRTVPAFAPVEYPPPAPNASMRVGRDEVRARLGHPHQLLLLICLAMVPLLFLMRLREAIGRRCGTREGARRHRERAPAPMKARSAQRRQSMQRHLARRRCLVRQPCPTLLADAIAASTRAPRAAN